MRAVSTSVADVGVHAVVQKYELFSARACICILLQYNSAGSRPYEANISRFDNITSDW